ncbi:hypothetical protein AVEN_62173-1 [Araneus ventricosus]|uniref:Uncharacterized protein n=1 Tax=Araneus ventricosus TaxID=182803 RepID=A0A4Y2US04_ARAVE|nr:hypothetical protein AVEN_62173-1 [Araneus ventricosus]
MINKSHATADEKNQLKGSNSVQARWLSSSVLPQRLEPHWCEAYSACILSLGLGLGLIGNRKCTPIFTRMNSARAEVHLFSILHRRIKFHLPSHGKVRDENATSIDFGCSVKEHRKS